jgi:hypothetical protein
MCWVLHVEYRQLKKLDQKSTLICQHPFSFHCTRNAHGDDQYSKT